MRVCVFVETFGIYTYISAGRQLSNNLIICFLDFVSKVWQFWIKIEKMGRNTSISLGSHFEDFINSSVTSGKYNSASEVVRSALRLLESEEKKLKELRNALIEGENSQMVENFNSDQHLADLHQRYL